MFSFEQVIDMIWENTFPKFNLKQVASLRFAVMDVVIAANCVGCFYPNRRLVIILLNYCD